MIDAITENISKNLATPLPTRTTIPTGQRTQGPSPSKVSDVVVKDRW